MKDFVLECCVDSVESALEADKGGADRIELAANLIIGGTSPSIALYNEIRRQSDIKIFVLLRPRFGDFHYTENEFKILKEEVAMFRDAGADGVVVGCLNVDGTLDLEKMEELVKEAGKDLIKELVEKAGNDIEILVGSGVNANVIKEFLADTNATSFHMSGKVNLDSKMEYRKEGVSMGLPMMSEYEICQTSAEKIREAREVLDNARK